MNDFNNDPDRTTRRGAYVAATPGKVSDYDRIMASGDSYAISLLDSGQYTMVRLAVVAHVSKHYKKNVTDTLCQLKTIKSGRVLLTELLTVVGV